MDWQKIINELMTAGISQRLIADAAGCSQPVISDLSNGIQKEVKYSIGEKILALHKLKVNARDATEAVA